MRFLFPLGLLGLLSLLILILIYILKPKYLERKISSSYIWKLSLKYKRKRPPWQWVTNSLLFILQVTILTILSLMLAQPAFAVSQDREKIIIIDGSASMMSKNGEKSRFEIALDHTIEIANDSSPLPVSIIYAGTTPSIIVQRSTNMVEIEEALGAIACTFEETDIIEATNIAKELLQAAPDSEVILISDHLYDDLGDITLLNVSSISDWNVAVFDFRAQLVNGEYQFVSELVSYGADTYVPVSLYIDGVEIEKRTVHCTNDQVTIFTFDEIVISYETAKIVITDLEDHFPYDNEFALFDGERDLFKVQMVTRNPIYTFSMLAKLGCQIDVHYIIDNPTQEELDNMKPILYSGYDLYIFDGAEMTTMPTDGNVWIMNVEQGSLPQSLGLQTSYPSQATTSPYKARFANSYETAIFQQLTYNYGVGGFTFNRYVNLASSEGFEVIFETDTINPSPLMLTKTINGVKVVVFTFSLGFTNLPIQLLDYAQMIKNIKGYLLSYPSDRLLYNCGEEVIINPYPNTEEIFIKENQNVIGYYHQGVTITAEAPGTYSIDQVLKDGKTKTSHFFVRIARDESNFRILGPEIVGIEKSKLEKNMSMRELATILASALLVIVALEWGLQYRELL